MTANLGRDSSLPQRQLLRHRGLMAISSSFGKGYMALYRWLSSLCLIGGVTSACSLYVDTDQVQCATDADCSERGPEFAGSTCRESLCLPIIDQTWACLDQPPAGPPATTTVHVNLNVVDLLSRRPLFGVRLTSCAKLDANCSFPIGQYESNEAGLVDVEMPIGFDGYLQAEGAGIYPTLIFPPSTSKQRAPGTLPLVPASFFGTMFGDLGVVSIGPDRSTILTTALDCLGRPAPGVILASQPSDDQTVSYVLEGGLPSRTARATDGTGSGGFVNVRAGSAFITSTIAATNRPVGTVAVQARPGFLTMVLSMPTGG